ncbi:MAG TPA: DedA family protein [Thermodesulfobacteriota bacterium]|nr:DedA family protein [Thermodesulfobacteriota bacterium]
MLNTATLVAHSPYIGIFVLLILGGIGFPFPEDATLMLAGFLTSQNLVKPVQAFLAVYPGLLISDFFLYWVGKKYGRMVVMHKRFQKIIAPDQILKLEEKFKRWGVWVVIIGRHFLGLRAQIFLVAGVMRMSPVKFLVADGATSLLTIALMGGIGYAGGSSVGVLRGNVKRVEHIGIVALMVLAAAWIFYRRFRKHRPGKEKAE